MFRGFFLLRLIMTLLIAGGLVAAGVLLYHSGFTNGYNAAVLAADASGKGGTTPIPYNGYLPYYPGFGFPFFSLLAPFGLFLGLGFFLFMIFIVSSVFRLWGWRRWAARPGMAGFGHHHDTGWFREWEEHYKGQTEKGAGPGEAPKETH
jgi:hypothetical protein